jgi:Tol biopolymer transport system component/imidazolonepropionase-like amidohydrolase
MKSQTLVALAIGAAMLMPVHVDQAAVRTLTFETSELTAPALTLTPDAQTLVFSALGHIYQMPVAGGKATQLTFGPSYDSDPAVSPDGGRVAFASSRDGSNANIFILELATKRVTQLTREVDATRPAWSPDGQTIAYARSLAREDHAADQMPGFADTGLREPRTVAVSGGSPTVAAPPRNIESVFYLPDGRLAWSAREIAPGGGMFQQTKQSRVEARGSDGAITVLATAPGDIGRVALGPRGDGIYYAGRGALQWLAFGAAPVAGPRIVDAGARIAVAANGTTAYFGDRGGLWRALLPSGTPEAIRVTAAMTLEVRPLVQRRWQPRARSTASVSLKPVMAPQISPDGTRVLLMAGGFLWEQPLSGAASRRLIDGAAFSRDAVYSPDGRSVAFVASEGGRRELRVFDIASRRTRALVTVGGATWPLYPSWSPDSLRIVFQQTAGIFDPYRIRIVHVADGRTQDITQTMGAWTARPHFSPDGRAVYYTSRAGKIAGLYRLALDAGAKPEPLTDLGRHVHEGAVSPDGRWLAVRRNSEIWTAPLAKSPVTDAVLRRLSAEGGRSFAFTPDSSAVVYTAAGRVWRQPLTDGPRVEVPVRISVATDPSPPLLVSRVRVLDFGAGRFTDETSMFVQNGRIQWIGADEGRQVPAGAVRLDAGGRFAIPGLFDAHVHSAWSNQQANEDAFIAFGITSVRDTGGTLDLLTALDDRSDLTALPAPRYFYSGEIFEGTMPHWGDAFYTIGTEQEARAEVRNLAAWGADFVKVYPSLPWHPQQAMADEAHRVGLPVVGHGLSVEEITRRVLWGSTSLEHSGAIFTTYDDVHRMLAAAGTRADLTLSVGGGTLMRASDPDWRVNWRVLEFVPEEARPTGQGGGGPMALGGANQSRAELLDLFKGRFERITSARGRGVTMTGGTDSLMGGVFFGLALHWEIAQFADAGVPPMDVLRMATEGGAALVGASADLGTLTSGKLADVVILEANPLDDIRNTQRIWQVVKDGRVYDPARLRRNGSPTADR